MLGRLLNTPTAQEIIWIVLSWKQYGYWITLGAPVPWYLNIVCVIESEDDHEVYDAADVENGHVEDEGDLETLDDGRGEGVGEGATEVPHQYRHSQEEQPYLRVSYANCKIM